MECSSKKGRWASAQCSLDTVGRVQGLSFAPSGRAPGIPSLNTFWGQFSFVLGSLVLQAPAHGNKKLVPFFYVRLQKTTFSGDSKLQQYFYPGLFSILQDLNRVSVRMKSLFKFQILSSYEPGHLPHLPPAPTRPPRPPVKVGRPLSCSLMRREWRWTLPWPRYTQMTVTPDLGLPRYQPLLRVHCPCAEPTGRAGFWFSQNCQYL